MRAIRKTVARGLFYDFQIFYYKSTRAYCFMRLKSCLVRTNVWHNKVACVFNNGKTESTKNSLDYGSPYCSTDNCTVHISSDNYDNHNSHNDHNTYDNYNNHLYYSHGS
ncbi:unnamed protein product [Nippostrongylus brasiliensis]|uniref:ZP domain-containing protein n=2 Tax=Nippostrongylus brasiliensis TaxID=27835 RepID=A0A0N4XJS2_NIPBR|nr:unnamed protein product [Nippostrongylus brasiliensis]